MSLLKLNLISLHNSNRLNLRFLEPTSLDLLKERN